ncbi:hypothetical protein Aspvir_003705 [Aspergillus viridinutans]|uniref:Uncharacterized protein n=1 Tax=Aspergillus viridinutans TaxID=75553 RepID=A0A9P3BNZ4_ASPVI|nr:uncharacterized protein Aspvir_003705 [Aspergillus viridinutans]GIJ99703.1 hypothetical protein Aspvir_003705 [Aspergillus viridinutans]
MRSTKPRLDRLGTIFEFWSCQRRYSLTIWTYQTYAIFGRIDAFFGRHLVTRDFTLPTRSHPRYHHAPVKLALSAPPSWVFHRLQASDFQHRPSNQKLYEGAENGFTSSLQMGLGSGQATRAPTRLPWPLSSDYKTR